MHSLLSSLSRNKGEHSQAYKDQKIKILNNLPYSFDKLNFGKENKDDKENKKFKRHPEFLPKLNDKSINLTHNQSQNNPIETNISSSTKHTDYQATSIKFPKKAVSKNDEYRSKSPSFNDLGIYGDDICYEADDELIIRPIKQKKIKEIGDFEKLLSGACVNMNISEVLGSDLISNDKRHTDPMSIVLKPLRSGSGRSQKSEELRLYLLKDLYGRLDFLLTIKNCLIDFGEILLNQFQSFNAKNHKLRLRNMKEGLYETLKNMKTRNDEIRVRLQNLSEQQLLAKKDTMESTCFRAQWDHMLLDLSAKSKKDNDILHSRMIKFIETEEIKLKDIECNQLKLEQASIKYAFIKLKDEVIKVEEKKQEIEHFIIRLEMRRENINKIEKEITTFGTDSVMIDNVNILTLIKVIKEDIIILWKGKMGEFGNTFKVDENQINNILNKENSTNSFIKEKGDTVYNVEYSNFVEEDIKPMKSTELKKATNKGDIELSMNQRNNLLKKLDYEILKQGQRISSSFVYSYLVHWPKESYQRDYKSAPSTDDEFEVQKKRNTCKLNYKTILANNPLLRKRKRNQKTILKKTVH